MMYLSVLYNGRIFEMIEEEFEKALTIINSMEFCIAKTDFNYDIPKNMRLSPKVKIISFKKVLEKFKQKKQ